MRDISNLTSDHLRWLAESNHKTLQHIDLSECVRISSQGFCQMAVRCVNLQQLFLAYQSGVTNEAMKFIIQNCHRLKELDLSGCRLLTDDAFEMLLEESDLYVTHLESVNLSGLESEISSTMIQELLLRIPTLQEICLGVAYDYNDATAILDRVNGHRPSFYLDVEKCHTICRMHYAPLGL
ncbi:uncharacterized protein BYT42DRAFT_499638 [Radiomyces spectabilis]|uniref:uncharacterized protein n=1 Tax=Radiomyces spectabilis TaxID=64574 RepID=UPI00221F09B8|nr:uncharacterized protein BYT42DRAFT_499638 [Radiomyces spectabilis]KAI8374501.1 hypothetical protein BYT42DRAFT_499638 [Radiomyces spectabilis]